jgi:hypothetical protein
MPERASDGRRSTVPAAGRSAAPGPQVLRSGSFHSLENATTGKAIVLGRPGGGLILRLERLSTSNGPDLRVYLSRVPASSDLHAYQTGFIDLGALKGNRGSQNYVIPGHGPFGIQERAHLVPPVRRRIRRGPLST